MLRRALAAILVWAIAMASATASASDRWRGTDGGHLWPGPQQLALTHATRVDLQTLQEVRARGNVTAVGLPCVWPAAGPDMPPPGWLRGAWAGPGAARPRNFVPSNHRTRGPPGPGSFPIES